MYYSNSTCQCGGDVSGNVQCSTNPDKVSITSCSCMILEGLVVGRCLYGCGFYKTSDWSHNEYHPLPTTVSKLNNAMCGRLKRDSRLCSQCQEGFSPLVYSYDMNCIKCTNNKYNWLKFIVAAFIPLTIFFFIVLLFRINATNPLPLIRYYHHP